MGAKLTKHSFLCEMEYLLHVPNNPLGNIIYFSLYTGKYVYICNIVIIASSNILSNMTTTNYPHEYNYSEIKIMCYSKATSFPNFIYIGLDAVQLFYALRTIKLLETFDDVLTLQLLLSASRIKKHIHKLSN